MVQQLGIKVQKFYRDGDSWFGWGSWEEPFRNKLEGKGLTAACWNFDVREIYIGIRFDYLITRYFRRWTYGPKTSTLRRMLSFGSIECHGIATQTSLFPVQYEHDIRPLEFRIRVMGLR